MLCQLYLHYAYAYLDIMTLYQKSDSSIDAYLLEEQSYQISSRSDLKRRSLRLFKERPNRKKNNKMSSDVGSVLPDPKTALCFDVDCRATENLVFV